MSLLLDVGASVRTAADELPIAGVVAAADRLRAAIDLLTWVRTASIRPLGVPQLAGALEHSEHAAYALLVARDELATYLKAIGLPGDAPPATPPPQRAPTPAAQQPAHRPRPGRAGPGRPAQPRHRAARPPAGPARPPAPRGRGVRPDQRPSSPPAPRDEPRPAGPGLPHSGGARVPAPSGGRRDRRRGARRRVVAKAGPQPT